MRARMFGPIEVVVGDRTLSSRDFGGAKPRQLLEILLVERGSSVTKDRIADLLWGEALPENVAGTLETYVSLLRRQLGITRKEGLLVTEPGAYRLDRAAVLTDLDEFDAAVAGGTLDDLLRGLALVRGEVLAHEQYGPWAIRPRQTYRERQLAALLRAAELLAAAGEHAAAAARAQEALALDPACERGHRQVMVSLSALGRADDALRAFQRCRAALREELGVDPQPATASLRDAIARREPVGASAPASASVPVSASATSSAPVGGELPLFGRRDELDHLERAASGALAGVPALLLVEGEAGIGKSRLLDELAGRLGPVRLARTKCFPLDITLPFAPLAAVVRQLDPPGQPDAAGYPCLGEIVPELGRGSSGEGARARAFESLVALVAARAPVALVFDDLQWADASTLAALDYLRRRGTGAGFVIVGGFRSEEVGPDHPVRRMGATLHLELAPLAAADLATVGGAALHARTGGNPLYVVECVRAAADGRNLPPSLRELILARSRAAGAAAHRLLVAASVLGRTFDPEVLAEVVDADPAEVLDLLEAMCERRLLRADRAGFDFRHDLIRETLSGSLSESRRRRLHARALDALEARHADSGELAAHAEAAGDLARALRLALTAGDAARARFAHIEAAAHYARALHLAEATPGLADPELIDVVLVRRGAALTPLRRHAEAEELGRRALASAESRSDLRRALDALEMLTMARQVGASDPAGALDYAEQALTVAERLGDPASLARAHGLVGIPTGTLGMIDDSLRHSHEALARAATAHLPPPPFALGRIALMHHMRGDAGAAIDWSLRGEEAAAAQRDEQALLMARWIRAMSLQALGRCAEAWRALDAMDEVGRGEESFWRARVPNTRASFLADLCLWDRAFDHDLEALEATRRGESGLVVEAEIHTVLNLASDRLALGGLTDARADIEWVRRQTSPYARFRWMTRMHAVDAELAVAEGDPGRAAAAAESCLALADKYGQSKNLVRGRLIKALALGAPKQAAAAARLADSLGFAHLAWRAWQAAGDLARARAAVRAVADRLDGAVRDDFLRAIPVRP